MNALRAFAELVRAQLIETARSRAALFWTLAFPLLFLFLLGGVMARGDARAATYMMPGLFINMLLGSALFSVALRLVAEREAGILRRYHATPVPAAAVVTAHGATALVAQLTTFFLLWGVGALVFGVDTVGTPVALVATFLATVVAILPLGLLIGSLAGDSRTAAPVANLIFFPMMFLSGAAFPFAFLPDAIQQVARFLPPTYAIEALHGVMVRGETLALLWPTLAVLLALGALGVACNALLFRWEGTEPVARRALLAVGVGLAVVVGGAAALSPAFDMARAPWTRTPEPGAAAGQVRVLRGMTVLDGLGGRIENARVTIRDHRVDEVTADTGAPLPAGAIVADLRGKFLVPGLIDSHLHLGGSGGVGAAPHEFSAERQVRDTRVMLGVGVTTLVSLTDDVRDMASLREAVALGTALAPRTFFAGPSVTAPGGHPSELFDFAPAMAERLTRQVATPNEARRAVQKLALRNVDLVKLVLEGGYPGHPMPKLNEATFRAAVAAAQQARLKTTVHVGSDADVRLALDAGADGVEHVPADLSDETIRLMAAKQMTLTPTLGVYDFAARGEAGRDPLVRTWADPTILAGLAAPDSPVRELMRDAKVAAALVRQFELRVDAVARAARGGVKIVAGSDSGNPGAFHGPALIRELELLVARAGLAPREALIAATSRAADRLGQKELGRIAPRAVADLVVLDADPEADIGALRAVAAVYFGGLPLDRARLLAVAPGGWVPGRAD